MLLDRIYHCQQGVIDISERTEAINTFFIGLGLEEGTPPRHKDHEGINPRWPPKPNIRLPIGRTDLSPPFYDLRTKGTDSNVVILSILVSILVECPDNRWAFGDRKSCWGLSIVSAP